jgi:hypothetical protein
MARYLGPKCKLSRREGTDLFLKSGISSVSSVITTSVRHSLKALLVKTCCVCSKGVWITLSIVWASRLRVPKLVSS